MIEERELLKELVDLVAEGLEVDPFPDSSSFLRLGQRAEALLERGSSKTVVEVDNDFVDNMFIQLEEIIRPRVDYDDSHLKMCQNVIEHNKEIARSVFVAIDMAIK